MKTGRKKPQTILTLGSGAARGFAHIGVLRCFEMEKIPVDMILGVSMGAIVGSIYSVVPESDFVEKRLKKLIMAEAFLETPIGQWTTMLNDQKKTIVKRFNKIFFQTEMLGKMATKKSLVSQEEYENFLSPFIPGINIEESRIPFGAVAVDIDRGEARTFLRGPMKNIVMASAAMPFMLPPQSVDGKKYVDGGVLDKMGIDAARELNPRNIITVDLSGNDFNTDPILNSIDVLIRTVDIESYHIRRSQCGKTDMVILPDLSGLHWADYNAHDEFLRRGYDAACEKIPEIRKRLKLDSFWRRFF